MAPVAPVRVPLPGPSAEGSPGTTLPTILSRHPQATFYRSPCAPPAAQCSTSSRPAPGRLLWWVRPRSDSGTARCLLPAPTRFVSACQREVRAAPLPRSSCPMRSAGPSLGGRTESLVWSRRRHGGARGPGTLRWLVTRPASDASLAGGSSSSAGRTHAGTSRSQPHRCARAESPRRVSPPNYASSGETAGRASEPRRSGSPTHSR
jgi:hypothetical protein